MRLLNCKVSEDAGDLTATVFHNEKNRTMRKILILGMLLFLAVTLYAQKKDKKQLLLGEFYEKSDEKLIHSAIFEYKGVSRDELMRRVKNWSGTAFISAKTVIVSETDDQIVFRYINQKFYIVDGYDRKIIHPWYIRMVVQVKDEKMRVMYFDDGSPSIERPIDSFKEYFKKKKTGYIAKNFVAEGLIDFKKSTISDGIDLANEIRNPNVNW